ncbi:MAG: hypothetical protein NDI90_08110 [Nitrospira sp. BO4]|jgi:hypothetical protein|nr:hypothetical protein [Nitrospira sp. BO4]
MATHTPGPLAEQPVSRTSEAQHAVVTSERRVVCRQCHTGVLKLYMCGPRLRGRCQSCGTVWVYLWSCTKQGWFRWSN